LLEDKVLRELETRIDALKHKDQDRGEARKTLDEVFDHSTLLTIYKLFTEEVIDTVEFSISTGKEANVFFAKSKDGPRVLKIYRVSNATFKTISKYITGDPRFGAPGKDRRRILFKWAQKEYANLEKALSVRARVPEVFVCRNNVLVMEYLGTQTEPAPMIKDVDVEDPQAFYEDLMLQDRRIFHKAELVHADLSEYNILMHKGRPYIIDMGQAVLRRHPMAMEFLDRDIKNLAHLFRRKGLNVTPMKVRQDLMRPVDENKEGSK
jgi:RIO kinase 1